MSIQTEPVNIVSEMPFWQHAFLTPNFYCLGSRSQFNTLDDGDLDDARKQTKHSIQHTQTVQTTRDGRGDAPGKFVQIMSRGGSVCLLSFFLGG